MKGPVQLPPESGVAVREPSELQRTSEHPVLVGMELRVLLPGSQDCDQLMIERHRPAGAIGFHIVHDLIHDPRSTLSWANQHHAI